MSGMRWNGVEWVERQSIGSVRVLPLTTSGWIDGIMFEDHKDGVLISSFFCSLPAAAALFLLVLGCVWGFRRGAGCSVGPKVLLLCALTWSAHRQSFRSHFSQGTLGSTVRAGNGKGSCSYNCHRSVALTLFLINVIVRSVDLTLANLVFNLGSNTMGVNSGKLLKFTVPLFLYLQNGNKSTYIKISLRLNKNKIHVKPVHDKC